MSTPCFRISYLEPMDGFWGVCESPKYMCNILWVRAYRKRISTAKGKVFPHWIGVKKNPDLKVTQSERNSERFHRLYHEKYLPNPSQTYIPFPRLHCHSVFIIFRAGERSLVKVRHSPLFLQFVIFERSQDQIFGSLCQSSTTWTCFYQVERTTYSSPFQSVALLALELQMVHGPEGKGFVFFVFVLFLKKYSIVIKKNESKDNINVWPFHNIFP